jgi:hypothetical protein
LFNSVDEKAATMGLALVGQFEETAGVWDQGARRMRLSRSCAGTSQPRLRRISLMSGGGRCWEISRLSHSRTFSLTGLSDWVIATSSLERALQRLQYRPAVSAGFALRQMSRSPAQQMR